MTDIDNLTIKQIKEINAMHVKGGNPYKIGQKYLIRTVTYYYTGMLKEVYEYELVLSDAAWMPDTGRYFDCLKYGKYEELEPIMDDIIIGRGAIIDCAIWSHNLPKEQK